MLQWITSSNPDFAISASTCGTLPATLAAGAACTVSIVFTPSGSAAESATLAVVSNATNGNVTVALSGAGATAGVQLSAAALAFGLQGVDSTSSIQTLMLTNAGNAALAIASIAATGADAGDFAASGYRPRSPRAQAAASRSPSNPVRPASAPPT